MKKIKKFNQSFYNFKTCFVWVEYMNISTNDRKTSLLNIYFHALTKLNVCVLGFQ